MKKRKTLLIIGPTAVGKSSLLERALKDYDQLVDIITYTTRAKRAGESEGNPYHFVTDDEFQKLMKQNFFLEWAFVHGLRYGTPRDQVEKAHKKDQCVIMDIDVQGAKKMKEIYPDAIGLFLMPPSLDALRQRFYKRGITNEADLARRLESARQEMAQADTFDHILVNDDFEETYASLRKIIENILKNQ